MMLTLFFIIPLCSVSGYELKQVFVLGRHNIRSPLASSLAQYTPKQWPTWNVPSSHLTAKGARLERYMGKYFSNWLIKEKVLSDNCPNEDQVLVYGNTRERTKETAKAFVEGAFGDCVKPYIKNITTRDPVFDIIVRNTTNTFKDLVTAEIRKELSKIDLKDEYAMLERILDFKNSSYCKNVKFCELNKVKHEIIIELNQEPDVLGPLSIANAVIDSFLMSYYDGMKMEDVAWGEIITTEQWKALITIARIYHDLRFKTPLLDKETGKILLQYMTDIFKTGKKKFYYLVGHDANITPVLSSLNFVNYDLQNQIEKTPIGGRVVFEKWYDAVNDRYLLRVNYVYQSFQQIRDGAAVSLENPPQWSLLQMQQCIIDKNGFCPWNDFVNILKNVETYTNRNNLLSKLCVLGT